MTTELILPTDAAQLTIQAGILTRAGVVFQNYRELQAANTLLAHDRDFERFRTYLRSHKERTDLIGKSMDMPKQAAEQIEVSDQTIYRWIAPGLISAITCGLVKKRYLIPATEIERIAREGNYTGKATPALVSA